MAPAEACDGEDEPGALVEIPYAALYWFFGDWMGRLGWRFVVGLFGVLVGQDTPVREESQCILLFALGCVILL